jgi:hypothetical protein
VSVGAVKHKRWKASLKQPGTARVQWQPVIGLGNIGVLGRF